MTLAATLIDAAAGRGYDTTLFAIFAQEAEVVIPSTTSRRAPIRYDRHIYKARNLTRYDKLARNFLAAAHIAAALTYWCN
ncbi:hypothetical protein [Aminobacter sp. DSM 101952]|uniref:hypothetical protein n=1 Tax=Aminobacter sp. DSM 101952 TaxID=2735891 RepID=UPI0012E3DBE3|nr:hypothetical protein [Aminobacter sp. DSM 101952]